MNKVRFSEKATNAIAALVIFSVFATSQAQAVGVPVIDAGAIAQAITQVDNQVKQIENMRNQLKALTDNGNYGALLNDPTVRNQLNKYLPRKYNDIFEAVRNNDLGALSQVMQKAKADEAAAQTAQNGKERVAATQLYTQTQMMGMMKTLDARSNAVESLIDRINTTQNAAQKADLANAISAQSAMINLDMNRMNVMMKLAERQEQLAGQQALSEYNKKKFGR